MPIFMDRHDLSAATAEDVAEAHRKDLEIQDKYGVRYMAYWFDEPRDAAFCLVHAPDAKTAERVHREAHGADSPTPSFQWIWRRSRRFSEGLSNPRDAGGGSRRPSTPGAARSCSPTLSVRPR